MPRTEDEQLKICLVALSAVRGKSPLFHLLQKPVRVQSESPTILKPALLDGKLPAENQRQISPFFLG